jgi:hypothetical protein
MSNTFKEFVTPELLNKMIHNIDRERVILNDNNNYAHIPTLNDIYITLAIYIRIQGLHIMPQENTRNGRPLRDSCMDAKDHFHRLDPSKYIFGIDIVTKLISLELFTAEYTEDLSKKFQEFVLELGNSCVGDEKLFHYTGLTKDIRLVVSKPGRVGLWFYELCAPLRMGRQFMLHTRMALGKEGLPVSNVVDIWTDIIKQYPPTGTILLMDSYYMDNTAKDHLDIWHLSMPIGSRTCRST